MLYRHSWSITWLYNSDIRIRSMAGDIIDKTTRESKNTKSRISIFFYIMTSYSDRLNIQYFFSFVKEFLYFFFFLAIHIKFICAYCKIWNVEFCIQLSVSWIEYVCRRVKKCSSFFLFSRCCCCLFVGSDAERKTFRKGWDFWNKIFGIIKMQMLEKEH